MIACRFPNLALLRTQDLARFYSEQDEEMNCLVSTGW